MKYAFNYELLETDPYTQRGTKRVQAIEKRYIPPSHRLEFPTIANAYRKVVRYMDQRYIAKNRKKAIKGNTK